MCDSDPTGITPNNQCIRRPLYTSEASERCMNVYQSAGVDFPKWVLMMQDDERQGGPINELPVRLTNVRFTPLGSLVKSPDQIGNTKM